VNRYFAAGTHEESSDIAKMALERANMRGHNIVLDGVGDSSSGKFLGKIKDQKKRGYRTKVILVDAPVDTAIARNIKRAERTGGRGLSSDGRGVREGERRGAPDRLEASDGAFVYDLLDEKAFLSELLTRYSAVPSSITRRYSS